MKLVGLSGTNGSGKDTVAELLAKRHNYLFISISDLLRDEAVKRNQPIEREVLRTISAEWRREFGLGVLIDKAVEIYEQKGGDSTFSGLVVSSIRNPGEIDRIHELGGELVWIDADAKVRYDRIFSRGRDDDKKTFEQFQAEEQAEMQHSGDKATLSMGDVKDCADKLFLNNHGDLEALEEAIAEEFNHLKK